MEPGGFSQRVLSTYIVQSRVSIIGMTVIVKVCVPHILGLGLVRVRLGFRLG